MLYYGGNLAERGIAIDYSPVHGTCYVAGRNTSAPTTQNADFWLLRLDSPSDVFNEPNIVASSFQLSTYPNPFNSTLTISSEAQPNQNTSISLYDLLGREVDVIHEGRLASSTISYTTPPTLSTGIYFIRAISGDATAIQKVVLLK